MPKKRKNTFMEIIVLVNNPVMCCDINNNNFKCGCKPSCTLSLFYRSSHFLNTCSHKFFLVFTLLASVIYCSHMRLNVRFSLASNNVTLHVKKLANQLTNYDKLKLANSKRLYKISLQGVGNPCLLGTHCTMKC